jgi:FkbM family methyltransferase
MPIEESWLVDAVGQGMASIYCRDLAIDVGANVGEWTAELSNLFASVLAFEPDHRAAARITRSENVTVHPVAVSLRDGKSPFYLRTNPGQNSLLQVHPIGAGSQAPAPVVGQPTVETVRLDTVAPGGADFVKIDVEGAEEQVLMGCEDVARWSRTMFVVECHDTRRVVVEQLWRLGKTVRLVLHPSPSAHPGHCWLIGMP